MKPSFQLWQELQDELKVEVVYHFVQLAGSAADRADQAQIGMRSKWAKDILRRMPRVQLTTSCATERSTDDALLQLQLLSDALLHNNPHGTEVTIAITSSLNGSHLRFRDLMHNLPHQCITSLELDLPEVPEHLLPGICGAALPRVQQLKVNLQGNLKAAKLVKALVTNQFMPALHSLEVDCTACGEDSDEQPSHLLDWLQAPATLRSLVIEGGWTQVWGDWWLSLLGLGPGGTPVPIPLEVLGLLEAQLDEGEWTEVLTSLLHKLPNLRELQCEELSLAAVSSSLPAEHPLRIVRTDRLQLSGPEDTGGHNVQIMTAIQHDNQVQPDSPCLVIVLPQTGGLSLRDKEQADTFDSAVRGIYIIPSGAEHLAAAGQEEVRRMVNMVWRVWDGSLNVCDYQGEGLYDDEAFKVLLDTLRELGALRTGDVQAP